MLSSPYCLTSISADVPVVPAILVQFQPACYLAAIFPNLFKQTKQKKGTCANHVGVPLDCHCSTYQDLAALIQRLLNPLGISTWSVTGTLEMFGGFRTLPLSIIVHQLS